MFVTFVHIIYPIRMPRLAIHYSLPFLITNNQLNPSAATTFLTSGAR